MTEWSYFKDRIPDDEIGRICDLALDTEHSVNMVQRGIMVTFVRSDYFSIMETNFFNLMVNMMAFVRKYTRLKLKMGSDEFEESTEFKELKEEYIKIMELEENEKKRMFEELQNRISNYPVVSSYIKRINDLLSVLKSILISTDKEMSNQIKLVFLANVYDKKMFNVSTEFLKEIKKREEETL